MFNIDKWVVSIPVTELNAYGFQTYLHPPPAWCWSAAQQSSSAIYVLWILLFPLWTFFLTSVILVLNAAMQLFRENHNSQSGYAVPMSSFSLLLLSLLPENVLLNASVSAVCVKKIFLLGELCVSQGSVRIWLLSDWLLVLKIAKYFFTEKTQGGLAKWKIQIHEGENWSVSNS